MVVRLSLYTKILSLGIPSKNILEKLTCHMHKVTTAVLFVKKKKKGSNQNIYL